MTHGRLLVPLYVHPAVDPAAWRALTRVPSRLYGVVLNVADGPGATRDPAFAAAAGALRAAGIRVLGYLDTAYGTRPHRTVLQELRHHISWYGTDGVFLDQAGAEAALLPYYRALTDEARNHGADTVTLNPGIHPDPGYASIADLLVTFEGDWRTYLTSAVPSWTAAHPPTRFCHLIHGIPDGLCDLAARIARIRRAHIHCAVPGEGANPWAALPPAVRRGTT
ncbi:spherulation-specific family 4 protein [Streptomyces fuscichromogenes]|uniref:spherulation-specific family 4 protein n=1 Tax=Streptomyces fuscichromogenes TaxID=1324013 RepID=UPI00381124C9